MWAFHPPASGIQIHSPELEWMLAAWEANETLASFETLGPEAQATIIAAVRVKRQIAAVLADTQSQQRRASWLSGDHHR